MDYQFKAGSIPLLVSMPHVGTDIPDDVAAAMTPAAVDKQDTDWHLVRLYEFLGEMVTDKLRYYPTVTRESYRNMGRITELLQNGKLFKDLDLPEFDPAIDRVMLCGSPGMLVDLKHMLEERGFVEGNTSTPGHFVVERAFAEK